MNTNRSDAYVRGYLTPDATDEWRKQGMYTPDQQTILENMRSYLTTPPATTATPTDSAAPSPQGN